MKIKLNLTVLILLGSICMPSYGQFGPGAAKAQREDVTEIETEELRNTWADMYTGPALDVAIPVFDPNIPGDPSKWQAEGIWPELRRAESVWFAKKLAEALEQTGIFNSVLVVPDTAVSADLYLMGTLKESNGEDLEIELKLFATTGKELMRKKKMKARVPENWYLDPRTQNQDPYAQTYVSAANEIVSELLKIAKKDEKLRKKNEKYIAKNNLKRVKLEALEEIRVVRHAQYGEVLSEEEFGGVTKRSKKGILSVSYIPDQEQDNWMRVGSVVSADLRFNQLMDTSYDELTTSMADSYRYWQKDAYPIAKGQREAKAARNRAVFGALLTAAVAANVGSNSSSTAGQTAAVTAAVASVAAATKAFQENEESKQLAVQLNELGNSVSAVLSPKVIKMESKEVELTGTATEQQQQWSTLLKEWYETGVEDFGGVEIVSAS